MKPEAVIASLGGTMERIEGLAERKLNDFDVADIVALASYLARISQFAERARCVVMEEITERRLMGVRRAA